MKRLLALLVFAISLLSSSSFGSTLPTLVFGKFFDVTAGLGPTPAPRRVAVDKFGNTYFAGESSVGDYSLWTVIKFDVFGNEIWRRQLTMQTIGSIPTQLDADDNGNVWIGGTTVGNATAHDIVTIKLLPNGTVGWIRQFDGGSKDNENMLALRHESNGSVRVAAQSVVNGKLALVVLTYDGSGKIADSYTEIGGIFAKSGEFNSDGYLVVEGVDATTRYAQFKVFTPNYSPVVSEVSVPVSTDTYDYKVCADRSGGFVVALNTFFGGERSFYVRVFNESGNMTLGSVGTLGRVHSLSAQNKDNIYARLTTSVAPFSAVARLGQPGILWAKAVPCSGVSSMGSDGVAAIRPNASFDSTQIFLDRYNPDGTLAWSAATNFVGQFFGVQGLVLQTFGSEIHYLGSGSVGNSLGAIVYRKYVEGPALQSIAMTPETLVGGSPASGAVKINFPMASDANIELLSSDPGALAVPASMLLPAGLTSAAFQANTAFVDTNKTVFVSARFGGVQRYGTVRLLPATLTSLTMPVESIKGGTNVAATLHLSVKTGIAGRTVSIASSNASLATAPATVTIPPGATTATFVVKTASKGNGTVTISATLSGVTVRKNLKIVP